VERPAFAKRKKRHPKHTWIGSHLIREPLRTSGLKEGEIWHIDPLLDNDSETNN
jgi:hypothetical protein